MTNILMSDDDWQLCSFIVDISRIFHNKSQSEKNYKQKSINGHYIL